MKEYYSKTLFQTASFHGLCQSERRVVKDMDSGCSFALNALRRTLPLIIGENGVCHVLSCVQSTDVSYMIAVHLVVNRSLFIKVIMGNWCLHSMPV